MPAHQDTMTSRQRVLAALNHQEPDRVPIDLGGNQTGIHKGAYQALIEHLGLVEDIEIMDAVVSEINAFTGHLSGYEKGDYAPFQGRFASQSLTLISTSDEIVGALGPPCRTGHNEHAPIPQDWLHYHRVGLKFAFNAETKRLSYVSVCPAYS